MNADSPGKQAGLLFEEPLVFERSRAGRTGSDLEDGRAAADRYLPEELLREPMD